MLGIPAVGASSPVSDLGFVDLVALVIHSCETGCGTDRAVDIDDPTADAADQMMMVVADASFEAGRRTRWLNATENALAHQQAERVVDRLERDCTDLGPDNRSYDVRCGMRMGRDRSQHRKALCCDLNAVETQEFSRVVGHDWSRICQSLE